MVSLGVNTSDEVVTRLSGPIALPRVRDFTPTGGGSVVVVVAASVGAGVGGASAFLHADAVRSSAGSRVAASFFMALSSLCRSRRSAGRRDLELLAGEDLVGVLDDVAVGLEDPLPVAGVAVHALGDLRQAVAGLHLVALVHRRPLGG